MRKTVKTLRVKVTYVVEYGNIEIPEKALQQIIDAAENSNTIDMSDIDYEAARDFLVKEIEENDCCEWEAEIEDIIE